MIPDEPDDDNAKDILLLLFLAERTQHPGFIYIVFLWEDLHTKADYFRRANPLEVVIQ